jgi:replicative DNA helicase
MTASNMNEPQKTFSFDRTFQEKIVQAICVDRQWAIQMNEVLDMDYFQYGYLKLVSSTHLNYYKQYKDFPSIDLLVGMLKTQLKNEKDGLLLEQVKTFLKKVATNEDLGDLPHVKEKALDFCKRARLQKALMQSVDLIDSENYDKIVSVVKEAIHSGNHHSKGLELTDDVDARYSETFRRTVPTGIAELDQRKILNGGLGAGELGVVVAPTGVGKSHCMVHFGAQAILRGKNVLHYTFELNERATGIRYDSHIMDIPSLECYDSKDEIKKYYLDNKDNLGRLIIKYYPTSSATVMTLNGHIEKLSTQGFKPDLIIIDYAGIMRSTDHIEILRLELKKVMEDLRGLATDLDIPLWTCIQSNKEGAQNDVVDLTNMSEGYGQAHVADFVLGLSRKSAQKATGFGNVFIAKNRAGIDGLKYQIHLDTSKSKLRILTDQEVADISNENVMEDDEHAFVRRKLREMQNKKITPAPMPTAKVASPAEKADNDNSFSE